MEKDRSIQWGAAIIIAVLAAILSSSAVYFIERQTFQARIQEKTDRIEQLQLEVTGLEAKIDALSLELEKASPQTPAGMSQEKRVAIQEKADRILYALKNKDLAALSHYVDPQKGLRLTPYTNINLKTDLVFPIADLPGLFSDNTLFHWGVYDGSGAPIDLTFGGYYEKFIYDQNFLAAPQIVFNQNLQRGNMINNFNELYPQGVSIEYYFPGFDAQYEGMDWESLKLVFEQTGVDWFLVGIIHEQWTI